MSELKKPEPNRINARLQAGKMTADLEVQMSSSGLLAVGALVSGILLSVVPIIWVSTRKLPDGGRQGTTEKRLTSSAR
ncbi:hypothetical protein [Falsirhodobacter deserti]|uniref:hypothetical protein n=1 Tax=Falsirhodobacter deserti TaxID=1365611 RepID=UPI000FE32B99|nr:hypothetical protein [Falsirhodobacter deserti]